MNENTKSFDWLSLALKIALFLVLLIALKAFITAALSFSFTARDAAALPHATAESPPPQEIAERAAAPEFSLAPEKFSEQTYAGLTRNLRSAGHNVRCYGNLKRNEKLYPSITQICWTHARAAWGMPLESISFHFAGDALQFVRMEFPNQQWPRVLQWYSDLPGKDAGNFGQDGKGNSVIGKSVAEGLLMTAQPPRGSTIMVLWEAKPLWAFRCRAQDRSITEKQKQVLCKG